MTDDVFTDNQDGGTESILDTLVGDDKKFKTVEDLAKGKAEADTHIAKLEAEAAEQAERYTKLEKEKGTEYTVADLMKAVKDATANTSSEDGQNQLAPEELHKVIKSVLDGEKAADTKAANRALGNKLVLSKVDGNVEAAKALVAERAGQLGMSPAKLAELSEDSPEAFANLMGVDSSTASSQGTAGLSGVNTDTLNQGSVLEVDGYKTKSYFDAKRKEMGNAAYLADTALQAELHKCAQALGLERFNQ